MSKFIVRGQANQAVATIVEAGDANSHVASVNAVPCATTLANKLALVLEADVEAGALTRSGMSSVIPVKTAFLAVFARVVEAEFPSLACAPGAPQQPGCVTLDPETLREELSNAISGAMSELGIEEPEGSELDWLGTFYDWVEETGSYLVPEAEEDEEDLDDAD